MANKKHVHYVVRIVYGGGESLAPSLDRALSDTPIIDQLRYAGLVQVNSERCFDLLPPRGIDGQDRQHQWASMNADRMSSAGYNAVAAPAWPSPADAACDNPKHADRSDCLLDPTHCRR